MSTARTNLIPGPAGRSAPRGGAANRITLPEKAVSEFATTSPLPVPTTAGYPILAAWTASPPRRPGGSRHREVAAARGSTKRSVERRLVATLDAPGELLPGPPTDADLDRLLDLLLLADKS